jgi:ribonuclease Z
MFGVTILGNNSALPAYDRHPTAQVVSIQDQSILIDCGEATQIQMSRYKVKRSKINHIFISHLHGDHYFGLIGLITSMGLLGRTTELTIFSPPGLQEIVELQLAVAGSRIPYPLHFHTITGAGTLIETTKFKVSCFPTQHRIPCYGFTISENKAPRKINKEKVIAAEIPFHFYDELKKGFDYETKTGELIKNETITDPASPNKKYVYTADTILDMNLVAHAMDANLLYHEATYLQDQSQKAAERFHATTTQAATIAKEASVKRLLIGHFSSKYESIENHVQEARTVFANTDLAIEGVTFLVQ